MSFFSDDKYQDRAWDWAKDMSKQTHGGWSKMYNQNLASALGGGLTPASQNIYGNAQSLLSGYGDTPVEQSDIWGTLNNLWSSYENPIDPFQTDVYKGASDLWQTNVEPLYDQMLDPMKRGIEGQYNRGLDSLLSTGVRGGSLVDALTEASMSRGTALSDMEKQLRSQDLLRLDTTRQQRAQALTDLAQRIYGLQEAGRMGRSGSLTQAGTALEGQRNTQGFAADTMLANLMAQLGGGDTDRAMQMANMGMQGRYLTGGNLAQSETGSNAQLMSGLMQMGSMLGLGLGSSGAFSGSGDMFGGIGGMTAGSTGAGTMEALLDLGVF